MIISLSSQNRQASFNICINRAYQKSNYVLLSFQKWPTILIASVRLQQYARRTKDKIRQPYRCAWSADDYVKPSPGRQRVSQCGTLARPQHERCSGHRVGHAVLLSNVNLFKNLGSSSQSWGHVQVRSNGLGQTVSLAVGTT